MAYPDVHRRREFATPAGDSGTPGHAAGAYWHALPQLPVRQGVRAMRRLLFPLLSSTAFVVAVAGVSAQNGAVTVTVDAAASKHAINPDVYGVAYATTTQLADLN